MQRTDVNPWTWQERFAFSQCVDLREPSRIVMVAGQGPVDAEGNLVHEGDLEGQVRQTMDNLQTMLAQAGLALSDVVRLTIFTTDMDGFFAAYGAYAEPLVASGKLPAASLIGVSRLAIPGMAVEIEATAAA